jgi:hypothetical protein
MSGSANDQATSVLEQYTIGRIPISPAGRARPCWSSPTGWTRSEAILSAIFALTTRVYDDVGRRVASLGRWTVILQEGGYVVSRLGENVSHWLRGFEAWGGER